MSDNAYDQMKYTKDEDFWSLKICIKRLFDISGIETVNIDCCRNGKRSCLKMLCANSKLGCIAFTRQYKDLDTCPACQSPRHDSNNHSRQFRYISLKHHIKLIVKVTCELWSRHGVEAKRER